MSEKRELDTRQNIKVVTSNEFITAKELNSLSLKARKLLYLTVSQCKLNDEEFYELKIPVPEFAELMGVDPSNVYREAFEMTGELSKTTLTYLPKEGKRFQHIPVMSICEYDNENYLRIELNKRMTDLLLQLKGSFTQPLLSDFLKMRSPYSMAVWHLMQREMKSKKPGTKRMEFYLSLEELRQVTGTENKLKQVGQFKERVLDKALREILENCGVKITYTNHKKGRTVIGFDFTAYNEFGIDTTGWEDENPLKAEEIKQKTRKLELMNLSKKRALTEAEDDELQKLILKFDQMQIDDFV